MQTNHACYIFVIITSYVQVLKQGKILEKEETEKFLKIISNEQAMKILQYTIDHPSSAYEISTVCSITLTQVYRWVRRLHSAGLIRVSGNTTSSGKKHFLYQSKIKSINITLNSTSDF